MFGPGIVTAPAGARSEAAITAPGRPARLSQAWAGTVAASAMIMLCGVATGILSARLLAPAGRGALAAVLFWPQLIASLGLLSLPDALICRRGRRGADRQAIAATAAWLALGLAAACAVGGALALPMLLPGAGAGALARAYLLAFLPFHFLALTLLAVDQGDLRFARYNLVRLLPSHTYLASLLVLWALDAVSVATLVGATWLGTAVTAAVRLWQAREALRARPSPIEARALLALGARFHGAALLAALLGQADRFVVLTFWDDASLGLYAVALTLAGAGLNVVAAGFHVLLLPRLAAADRIEARRRILGQTLRYAMLLLTAGTMVLLALCPWLMPLLFGDAYAGATDICIVLLLGFVPTALRQTVILGLCGSGEWRPRVLAESLTLAVFGFSVWPLARSLGILGVPAALLVANLASLAYLLAHLRARWGLRPRDCWGLSPRTLSNLLWHGRALWKSAGPVGANG
jgi:O-antigen/teichoic acid export membrane protein